MLPMKFEERMMGIEINNKLKSTSRLLIHNIVPRL
jgi:hypothetical protein